MTILHNLLVLTGRLREWLKSGIAVEKQKLLEIVKARFTAEEILEQQGKGSKYELRFQDIKKRRK